MASKTEYEMLWKLGAELGKDFNGTFNSAQKILVATQKEIQALNKQQSDIAGYTRQQQSVEKSNQKLDLYKQQLANVRTEISQNTEFSSALANKEAELQAKIKAVEAEIANKTDKLQKMGEELSESGIDVSNLSGEAERLKKELEELKEAEEKAGEEADAFGEKGASAIEDIGSVITSVGIAKMLGDIAHEYAECVKAAAAYGDEIGTISTQYGFSYEQLQSYYYAAELVDVSVDTLTKSMAKNIKSMKAVQDGTKLSVEAYEALGISVTNTDGSLRDSDTVYWEVIDALSAMENETQRDSLAQQLLGRSAMELNTLIKAGSGVMAEYTQMAKEAGYVLSDELLDSLMAMDDQFQINKTNVQALKNVVGASFSPEITAATKVWNDLIAGTTQFAEEHPVLVKSLVAISMELMMAGASITAVIAAQKLWNVIKDVSIVKTIAETVATKGLTKALLACPYTWAVAGVAALTVGIVALVDTMGDATAESEQLTAASREQAEEIEALKNEYAELKENGEEASYEAWKLEQQIDELSATYETSKQTLEEYNAEHDEAISRYKELADERAKSIEETELESEQIISLTNKLSELSAKTGTTASEKQEMLAIIKALNSEIPALNLSYSGLTSSMDETIAMVTALAEAEANRRKYETYQEEIIAALNEKHEINEKLLSDIEKQESAQAALAKAEEELAEAEAYARQRWVGGTPNGPEATYRHNYVLKYEQAVQKATKELENTKKKVSETRTELQGVTSEIDNIAEKAAALVYVEPSLDSSEVSAESKKILSSLLSVKSGYLDASSASRLFGITEEEITSSVESATEYHNSLTQAIAAVESGYLSAEEAAKAFGVSASDISDFTAIQTSIDAINELGEAYSTAKEEAEKSIQGQFDLWEKAAIVIPTNIGTINTALETQISYWTDYNTDLQSLLARADDIEGLKEAIASMPAGTADTVNSIAGMAQATDEELKAFVSLFKEAENIKKTTSDSFVDLSTDFEEEMALLEKSLNTTIDDMELADEATIAAKETINAYAEAIRNGEDEAVKAAERLSALIAAALQFNGTISVDVSAMISKGEWKTYEDAAAARYSNIRTGHEFSRSDNADKQEYGTYDKYLDAMYQHYVTGYAVGTDNATPGVHLVGENGPELVMFNGGEKVFTAPETQVLLRKLNAENNAFNSYANGTGESITMLSMMPMLLNMYQTPLLAVQEATKVVEAAPIYSHAQTMPPIHVSYQIEINGDSDISEEQIRRVLDEQNNKLEEMINDVLERQIEDKARMAYF